MSQNNILQKRGIGIIIVAVVALSALFGVILFRLSSPQKPVFERQLFGEWEYKSTIPQALTAYYKKNDTDVTVKIERGDSFLEFSYPFQNTSIVEENNTLIYKSQNLPIETRYDVVPGGIKEEIVLYKIPQETTFSSVIKTNGVVPSINSDGIIAFYNAKGAYQFHFERPFVKDAKGVVTYAVKYKLKSANSSVVSDGKIVSNEEVTVPLLSSVGIAKSTNSSESNTYVLDIEVDSKWLHDKARVLPIVIDPTVVHDTSSEFASGVFDGTRDVGTGTTFTSATGGTITTSGDYVIHTFTTNGTFTPNGAGTVEALVVGGGGGGANTGSGGGGGGYIYNSNVQVTAQSYSITVGNGGTGGQSTSAPGAQGGNSIFSTLTAVGGGGGTSHGNTAGGNGGSGGGGPIRTAAPVATGGTATAGQGNNGGAGFVDAGWVGSSGGGGGAGAAGSAGGNTAGAGKGGDGLLNCIRGTCSYYAGGGGGGEVNGSFPGAGGLGGGGSAVQDSTGGNGGVNTGGGGAGGSYNGGYPNGGNGGSGIVIIRYKTQKIESYYRELTTDQYTSGLWHMNEASGTIVDSSGNGNSGTASNTTYDTSSHILGTAAQSFNGVSSNIGMSSGSNVNVVGDITVETWIKPNNFTNTASPIHKDFQYSFSISTLGYVAWADSSNWNYSNFGYTDIGLVPGVWQHLAFTKSNGVVKIYLNGAEKASKSFGSSITSTNNILRFGCYAGASACGSAYFNGSLDEVRISTIARTADEIKASASRRPSATYTSDIIDVTKVASWNSLTWTEGGVQSGDGETPYSATNLVAHWKFNESSGTTATNNAGSCGATCNGTVYAVADTTTRDSLQSVGSGWTQLNRRWGEGALMLDGVDDYVSIPDNDFLSFGNGGTDSPFTIEAWVNPETLAGSSDGNWILNKRDGGAGAEYQLAIYEKGVWFGVFGGTTNYIGKISTNLLSTGSWYHIVGTYDGSKNLSGLKIYINGIEQNTSDRVGGTYTGMSNGLSPVIIGKGGWDSGVEFDGVIDSIRVYSRALGAHEVLSNYNTSGIEIQTRVGNSANPDDGTWEAWTPTTKDTLINSFDTVSTIEPSSLSGLALWLKADALVGYSDGQAVVNWADSSGNSRTFTQANAPQQPAYKPNIINGKPIVRFTAASSQTMTNATNFSTPSTVIYLSKQNGGTNGRVLSGLNNNWLLGYHGARKRQAYFGNGWVSQIQDASADTAWHIYTSTHNGATSQAYEDGNMYANGPNGVQGPNGLALIGYLGTSEFSDADIAEVIVYNRVLTDNERKKIEYYLAQKYNLTVGTQPFISTDQVIKTENTASTVIRPLSGVDSSVVGYWKLDETGGSGAYLKDDSSLGNHGTPVGSTSVPGVSGKAHSFNGSSSYISVPDANPLDITRAITIDAWIKLNTTSGYQTIVAKRDVSLAEFNYGFRLNGDELEFYFLGGGVTHIAITQNTNLITNKWYHVAVVYDVYKSQFYVDGVRQSSTCTLNTCAGEMTTNNDSVGIGRAGDNNAHYLNGLIDEVRISNVARTAQEIKRFSTFSQHTDYTFALSPVDLRNKTMLSFQIAGDRPGNYLSLSVGENNYSQYQSDSNVIAHYKFDEGYANQYNGVLGYPIRDSAGMNNGESSIKFENFNTSDTTFWTYNLTYHTAPTNLAGENVLNVLGTGAGYVSYYQTTPSITSGQEVIFDFYRTATTFWHMGALTTTTGHRWAIQEDQVGGLRVQYSPDATNFYYPKTLIATAETGVWYRALLRVDDVNGFYMAIWKRSDPRIFAEYTNATMPTGQTWRFQGWQYQATNSYIDNFQIRNANPELYTEQGKLGESMKFDGNNFVNLHNPSALQMTGNQTIEMWLYPTDFTVRRNPYNKSYGGEGTITQEINRTLNYYYGTAGADTTPYQGFNSGTPLTINQWNYIALVRDLSGLTLTWYINGLKTNTTTASYASAAVSSLNAMIGNGYTNKYVGKIDELRISDIARSAEEIRQSYEYGLRTHPITIEFGARLDSGNLISDVNDFSFTIDATSFGISQKGGKLYSGDKIIVRENFDGTEYKAQGTVTSVVSSTGATTVAAWDTGSTFPAGGFTTAADVFKWQTEYWNITTPLNTHIDSTSQLALRITNGREGRNIWLDNLKMGTDYLTTPLGSTINSSTGYKYFQYRTIFHSGDEAVSASMNAVSLQYTVNTAPNTPTLNSPTNVATGVSRTPTFYTTATDANSDHLQYKITLCTDSNMTQNCQTFDQTQSQTGWTGQNADSGTAYNSSTQGIYTLSTPLTYWTTYYWKSTAIDPDGINTWSGTQTTPFSFTTIPIEPATNCKVTRVGTANVVEWTDNASIEVGYAIQRNVNNGGWTNLNMGLAANTTSYNDTPVQNNTTYQYRVAPYLSGPQYTAWCQTSTQNISVGTLRFEGNFNFSGIEVQ